MYYQNYDDYMRDVFYFNQMPNQNMGFQMPNQNMGFNQMNSGNQIPNYNNMYPSIYRIIQPVVSRVVTGNNYQYLTEESLSSMVDTVYNIVEGDVTTVSENESQSSNSNQPRTQSQSTTQTSAQPTNSSSRCNDNNQNATVLLKDLIRIMILKEIMNRNNMRRMPNNCMFQNQFYPNCYDQRYMC